MRLSNFRNRFWKKALQEASIDSSFRIHDQRHTAISLWIKAGINVKEVSVNAGHTSVAFTCLTDTATCIPMTAMHFSMP